MASHDKARLHSQWQIAFCRPKSFRSCKYLEVLWQAWESLKQFLQFQIEGTLIPHRWMVKDLLSMVLSFKALSIHHQWRVMTTCGKLGIRFSVDLWETSSKGWKLWNNNMKRLRDISGWLKLATLEVLSEIHSACNISFFIRIFRDGTSKRHAPPGNLRVFWVGKLISVSVIKGLICLIWIDIGRLTTLKILGSGDGPNYGNWI